jgi:hypothetical protein
MRAWRATMLHIYVARVSSPSAWQGCAPCAHLVCAALPLRTPGLKFSAWQTGTLCAHLVDINATDKLSMSSRVSVPDARTAHIPAMRSRSTPPLRIGVVERVPDARTAHIPATRSYSTPYGYVEVVEGLPHARRAHICAARYHESLRYVSPDA